MKTKKNKLYFKVLIALITLSYFLVAQDNAQLDGGGNSTEPTGFEEVLLNFNELSTDEIKQNPILKRLHPDFWNVKLNESSSYLINQKISYAKKVDLTTQDENLFLNGVNQGSFLGIRASFPKLDANNYITVTPDFPVLTFSEVVEEHPFTNKGFINNVDSVKTISSYIFGANYPYTFSINLRDEHDILHKFLLGSLEYLGWKELVYNNLGYIENIRQREITSTLRYPYRIPFFTFDSFVVFRHSYQIYGDFITYVSWVKLVYDKNQVDNDDEIDGESIWEILKYRGMKATESQGAGMRYMNDLIDVERKKMNLPPINEDNNNQAQ